MNGFGKVMRGVGKFFKKFRVLIILLVIGFIILTFVRYTSNTAKKVIAQMETGDTEIAKVEARDLVETVTATGTVESAKKRTVASTIVRDTKITSVNCEVGDYVEEGDILVTFSYESINKTISQLQEDIAESKATKSVNDISNTRTYYYAYGTESIVIRDLQTAIDERQKELNEACNEYGDAKRKLDELKEERDRHPDGGETETMIIDENTGEMIYTKNYFDPLIESQENAVATAYKAQENAQMAYDKAVQALEDEIYKGSNTLAGATETYQKNSITSNDPTKQLQRQLEDYRDKLDDYVIIAPISGLVTDVNVEENNSFAGGNIATIQDCSTLYINTEIDEYDIPNIKVGQRVVIKTDATREDELEGVIDEIAQTATNANSASAAGGASAATTSNATYSVKIKVISGDERLKLGMTAKLSIVIDEKDNVLTVPYDAVVDKGDGEYVVYMIDEAVVQKADSKDEQASVKPPLGFPGTGTGVAPTTIPDMQKDVSIPDMTKEDTVSSDNAIASVAAGDEEKKPFFERMKDILKVAYGPGEDEEDIIEKNQKEIPVEVGMESDYYTQISGKDVKEGMSVVVKTNVEPDNPFEIMMSM